MPEEKLIRDKSDFELDYRIVPPDKGVRDINVVGHAVLDRPGDFGAFVGTVIDITERKRAEQELQQLVDIIPQLIVVLAPDGKWTYANRMAREYTGLTLEEFRSKEVIGRAIHPDDVERARIVRERGLAGSDPFELDARQLGKDGIYRWFLWRYNPLVEEGRVRRWYVSATEIESRKQEKERVRQENVRLEERTRIAQELHDTLLQNFLSASMQLGATVDAVPPDSPVKVRLDRILQLMEQGIEDGRKALQGLRLSDTAPWTWFRPFRAFSANSQFHPTLNFGSLLPVRSSICILLSSMRFIELVGRLSSTRFVTLEPHRLRSALNMATVNCA
jgi:PAS domain S-box-containing protein